MDTSDKHSKAKTVWLLIIIFLLGVSNTAWGLFYFKQNQNTQNLNSEISTLNNEKTTLAGQVSSLQTTNKKLTTNDQTKEQSQWREIPELGVQYKITDNNKDLTYQYSVSTGEISGLESINVAFTSVFSLPLQDKDNSYEYFPYTAFITKYPQNRLKDFSSFDSNQDINEYSRENPKKVKKIGSDTYVISVPDGGALNPRAKAALEKQEVIQEMLASFEVIKED